MRKLLKAPDKRAEQLQKASSMKHWSWDAEDGIIQLDDLFIFVLILLMLYL